MHNLYANFVKILEICKDFSKNLVNELGNIPRPGVVPRFSDLEVVALSLTAEHLSIDSENNLFDRLKEYKADMPNLISRRQFNGLSGVIHSYDLSPANVHDIHFLKDVKFQFHDCCILGDRAYLSA